MKTRARSGSALTYSRLLAPSSFFFFVCCVFVFPTSDYSIAPGAPRSRYLRSAGLFLFGAEADERIGCFSGEPRVPADGDTNSGFLRQPRSFPTQEAKSCSSRCVWGLCLPRRASAGICCPNHASTAECPGTWARHAPFWHGSGSLGVSCPPRKRSLYASHFLSLAY